MGANQSSDTDLMPRKAANLAHRRSDEMERISTKSKAKPLPPHRPVITDVTHNSITVSWQPPHRHNGHTIIAYTVEMAGPFPESKQWRVLTASCQSTSYTARYLSIDSAYAFRVRAENIFGVGKVSAPSDTATTKVYETSSDLSCFMNFGTSLSNAPIGGSRKRYSDIRDSRRRYHEPGDRQASSLRRRHSFNVHLNGGVKSLLNHSDINIEPASGPIVPVRNETGRAILRNDIYRTSLKPNRNRSISSPIFLPGTGTESLSRLRESRSSFKHSGELSIGSGDSTPTSHDLVVAQSPRHSYNETLQEEPTEIQPKAPEPLPLTSGFSTFGKDASMQNTNGKASRGSWQSSTSDIATTDSCCNSNSSGSNRNSCDSYSNSTSSGVDVANCSDCSLTGISELGQYHRASELPGSEVRGNTSLDLGSPCSTLHLSAEDSLDSGQFHAGDILSHLDDELDLLKDIEERLRLDSQLNESDEIDSLPPPPPSLLSPPLQQHNHHHHSYNQPSQPHHHYAATTTTVTADQDVRRGYYDSLENPWEPIPARYQQQVHSYSYDVSDPQGNNYLRDGQEEGGYGTPKSCTEDQDFRSLRSALNSNNIMVKRSRLHGDGQEGGDDWSASRGGKLSTIIDADEEEDAVRVTSI